MHNDKEMDEKIDELVSRIVSEALSQKDDNGNVKDNMNGEEGVFFLIGIGLILGSIEGIKWAKGDIDDIGNLQEANQRLEDDHGKCIFH